MSKLQDYIKRRRLEAMQGSEPTKEPIKVAQVELKRQVEPIAKDTMTMAERLAEMRKKPQHKSEHKSEHKAEPSVEPKPQPKAVVTTPPVNKETFLERVARLKAEANATQGAMIPTVQPTTAPTKPTVTTHSGLNLKQSEAAQLAKGGNSFALLGAAGTGKTHTVVRIVDWFANYGGLEEVEFRDPSGGCNDQEAKLAIACVSFTNRAVNNMYSALRKYDAELAESLKGNYLTVHKLLEYRPVFYAELDANGVMQDKMRFEPQRDSLNKLPIKVLIVEEGSTLDMTLWTMLLAAVPDDITIIFLGDLNQLAPVFGDSILQYAVRDLPLVELTEVYRQAQGSPVIEAAYQVLGKLPPTTAKVDGLGEFMHIDPKANLGTFKFAGGFVNILKQAMAAGRYDPMTDMVLSPFNKYECGTIELAYDVATLLDNKAIAAGTPNKIYEVAAGYNKLYLAVGDRVYVNKMEGIITEINPNGTYLGMPPQGASTSLTRFGVYSDAEEGDLDIFNTSGDAVINIDAILGSGNAEEDRVLSASHAITIELETGETTHISSAGELNSLALGYTLTTHKAQGCEYGNVFILIHKTHLSVASNEWLYTAITRAKTNCYILADELTLQKVASRKRIKGDSLAEKREYFIASLEDKIAKALALGNKHTEAIWTSKILNQIANE